MMMAFFALLIFLAFAIFGGLAVLFVIRSQSDQADNGEPPRGAPRNTSD